MKKLLVNSLLLFSLLVKAQNETPQIKIIEPPDSTGFGTPEGRLISKEIGIAGGRIASNDGRVELIFPSGALTANTVISIQPTTNPAPNASGEAYQFEPSGIQFKKPVQIIFHYTDEEAETGSPDLMGLALQDKNGKWTFFNYAKWDSASKTLTGFIHHFTGGANVHKITMRTGKDHIPVFDTTNMIILDNTKKFGPNDAGYPEDQLADAVFEKNQIIIWYVNGVQGGNKSEGTISKTISRFGKEQMIISTYQAPDIMPGKDPVTIWAEFYLKTRSKKIFQKRMECKVSVYDAYKIQVINEFTGRPGMNSQLIDSASFDLFVYPDSVTIWNIKNYEPIVIKEGKMGPFKEKIRVKNALGPIHITEFIKNGSVSHAYPPVVHFEFPSHELPGLISKYTARGIDSPPRDVNA